MLGDRALAKQQLDQGQAARWEAAQGLQGFASGRQATETKTRAAANKNTLNMALAGREQAGLAGMQPAQQAAQNLALGAEQRRTEALQAQESQKAEALRASEAQKTSALGKFTDDTALALQGQRTQFMAGLGTRKQEIINQAAARGFGADSPEVQQQIRMAEMDTMGQVGQLAGQLRQAYNTTAMNLNMAYDQMNTQTRQIQDQLSQATRMQEDQYVGLSQSQSAEIQANLAQMGSSLRMAAQQEQRLIEQQTESVMQSADQFQLAGAEGLAGMARDWSVMLAPMAPILSLAASMTNTMLKDNQGSITAANSMTGVEHAGNTGLVNYGIPYGTSEAQGTGGTPGGHRVPPWGTPEHTQYLRDSAMVYQGYMPLSEFWSKYGVDA